MEVRKSDGSFEEYDKRKLTNIVKKAFKSAGVECTGDCIKEIIDSLYIYDGIMCSSIRKQLEERLGERDERVLLAYRQAKEKKKEIDNFVEGKKKFINNYKKASNTANATVDDNSNVGGKNIGVLNAEIHKSDNIQISRGMIMDKLKELYPDFNAKNYAKDLENHIIYKHDESSFAGPIAPYCVSVTMYPFLTGGIKGLGGLSAAPKNLDSFCGMFCNFIFAVAGQYAGAVAVSEALLYFTYFAKKEWGEDFYKEADNFYKIGPKLRKLINETHYWAKNITELKNHDFGSDEMNAVRDEIIADADRPLTDEELAEYKKNILENPNYTLKLGDGTRTICGQIHQYWQQIVYTINQPAASRGMQSAFVNFSYFDEPFFEGMFGEFCFPDGTRPDWESLKWVEKEFMMWFNAERLRTMLTFPVESFTLLYKDGKFVDEEMFKFVCDEYARGHSFFTYISDTVDSLSSCCFSKNQKVLWKSSTKGVNLTTLENLYNTKWEPDKKNLKIFHNGSWVKGKVIKLPNRKMYKVITENNKEMVMTDNHINVTLNGEKHTSELSTNDYLMFNTMQLNAIPENNEHLTYEEGFVIGAFLGDGSFGSEINGTIYDTNFSQNKDKYEKMMEMIDVANKQLGFDGVSCLNEVYNNVYPVRISSKGLAAFIMKWTNWGRGTYYWNKELNLNCLLQSVDFRRGILDGWYNTDGGNSNRCYTTSEKLAECMEVLITSLGMQSIIDISDRMDEPCIRRGIEYKRNYPLYCVRWYESANHKANKYTEHTWIKKNNSIYFKIKSIKEIEYSDDVYCIECDNEDEPYFTLPCGVITHNCRLKNKIQTKEFNFTNGNISVQTGSKSVISINLSRIIQNWFNGEKKKNEEFIFDSTKYPSLRKYIAKILERVYKYHTAYNEQLWDMYDADLLPVYKAGFIDLNKQYLTIGINGLNQAAEFLGMECSVNDKYSEFCREIFSEIKEQNALHKVTTGQHKLTFNTECVPAESLAAKNYKWDAEDGYWVPEDTNLYASYIFKPNDKSLNMFDKLKMHGANYIGDYLDGGAACHLNSAERLTTKQYAMVLKFAAENGCQYLTFNIPNCECNKCGFIAKHPFDVCPHCGSTDVSLWDRVIGYLTKIKNWSTPRQIEQKTRVYEKQSEYFKLKPQE